jgi:alpha-L-fucosidase 2
MSAKQIIVSLMLSLALADLGHAEAPPGDAVQAEARRIVGQYKAIWTARPARTPANHSVDGPLMGNGDMKVGLGGPAEEQRFYLAKNDMWRLKSRYGQSCPVGFGHLAILVPELKGATYNIEQTWADPETVGTFKKEGTTVRVRSMVAATRNLLILELEAEGKTVEGEAVLRVAAGRGSLSKTEQRGSVHIGQRAFLEDVDIPSGTAVAWTTIGGDTRPLGTEESGTAVTQKYRVQLGREQYGNGRWGFKGAVDDLRVYGKALKTQQLKSLMSGEAPEGAVRVWDANKVPEGAVAVKAVPGTTGQAWQFNGSADSYLDCGDLELPTRPVTVACWIRIDDAAMDGNANYILSCGAWNTGVSLGLSTGKLRFTVNGRYVETEVLKKGKWIHVAGTWDGSQMAAHVDGEEVRVAGNSVPNPVGVSFTLAPGKPLTLVMAMDSVFKNKDYVEAVVKALSDVSDESALSDVRNKHAQWWAGYWAKSHVEIGDPLLEQHYYRSLYAMGALSRAPRFPPGIFGLVTTDNPGWAGDYHLNYNHMAPFYALYSANRVEQGDPEDAPILDFRERGRWYAKNVFNMRGVHYPVGVGPLGIETTRGGHPRHAERGGLFFGQRSNPAYCLVNIAQRWRTTLDPEYGRTVYPYVLEVVSFWEDYLTYEKGPDGEMRYAIYGDSIHEGSGKNMNPILTLGLVRNSFDLALGMSQELGVDAQRREKWEHILKHLSSWTTQQMGGKEVFRYTEKGTHWWGSNTLGIQHIYPGNALGLDSDTKWIQVSHNTIAVMGRWFDFNGSNSFFPAAVRVGYDPAVILAQLQRYTRNTYPNGFQLRNPHGIENFSTVPNTINEMLCMSHVSGGTNPGAHLLRVFSVWPKDKDAKFANIRAWGAFLVSGELKSGEVQYVKITSERGKDCTMVNPWPGRKVVLSREKKVETLSGDRFTFKTKAGEMVQLSEM